MKTFTILLFSLFLYGAAEAQMTCVQIAQFLSCDAGQGRTSMQTDLGNGMGVIMDGDGNIEPYAVMPSNQRSNIRSPLAPQPPLPPRAPAPPSGGTSDLIFAPSPAFAPISLGGDSGQ